MVEMNEPRLAALSAFQRSIAAGASRDAALEVALASLRAAAPASQEWELRAWLARALAEERLKSQLLRPA